jgi:hypothetical protein
MAPIIVHNDFVNSGRPFNKNASLKMLLANRQVYRLPTSRFCETVVKPALFHLAKTIAHRRFLFLTLPLFLLGIVLIGPFYYWEQLSITTPFSSFISGRDPANVGAKELRSGTFNSTNPAFDAIRRTSQAEFAVLLTTRSHFTNIISNSTLSTYLQLQSQIRNLSISHSFVDLRVSMKRLNGLINLLVA